MRLNLVLTLCALLPNVGLVSCSAASYPYNPKLITTQTEVKFAFSANRGILSADGTIYFVPSSDESAVFAYYNNRVVWQVKASRECGLDAFHQVLRTLKLTPANLEVVYGKHSFLTIVRSTEQVTCQGRDQYSS
ncbi:hypothetical protein [Hymenobacter rubripertinctus]|uniref:hypothetical protein n=1 Tax=Hymenobacter rubripertinctus TaxID=2029981 RepID=UPI0036D23E31